MKKTKIKPLAWSPDSERAYTQQRIEKACTGNRSILRAFAGWLEEVRGLSLGTITTRLGSACTFADAVASCAGTTGIQAFKLLTPDVIEDFFVQYGQDHGMAARRNMGTAMRSFLKFIEFKGWVGKELIEAVPRLSSYRLSGLPSGPSDEEFSTLFASTWEGGMSPRRDQAIVYLLATYGARRGQLSALRLVDVDWSERTILFAAHKGGKAVHHVLTQAVGQALANYLRYERPPSDCEYVFLRAKRPYLRLSPGAVTCLVRCRMVRCGLPAWSPHKFRHAFATRLLRVGQPVKAIADLLGHRSLDAVAIYAKVDYARLFEVAVEWPEVIS